MTSLRAILLGLLAFCGVTHTTLSKQSVDRTTVLDVHMVSGGGNAVWIHLAGVR
ncbi:MAG: hypothetical protein P4K94_00635 [Terracidiphilus sp.]|nr:hypothetical protein [Terracidiphilus sp.]